MSSIMQPGSLNLVSLPGKIQVITALENMAASSTDQEYIDYCKYCLSIVRQGIELDYEEVLDFIGVTNEPVPAEISIEVIFLMEMFEHISLSLSVLPITEAREAGLRCYTRFTGFEGAETSYISAYIYFKKSKKYHVPIFKETLPLTMSHYREMLIKYERYKRQEFLTKEMIMDICIWREQQLKLIL